MEILARELGGDMGQIEKAEAGSAFLTGYNKGYEEGVTAYADRNRGEEQA